MQMFIRNISVKSFHHLDINTQRCRGMLRSRISSGITGAAGVGLAPWERHILAQQCPGDLQKVLDAVVGAVQGGWTEGL